MKPAQSTKSLGPKFGERENQLFALLKDLDQGHLFDKWPDPIPHDEKVAAFFDQIEQLDRNYPGGLRQYVENAKNLLAKSREGHNPYLGARPEYPEVVGLEPGSPAYMENESTGIQHVGECSFVMVAGGLGERLGYSGIKIALPSEVCTGQSFLGYYCESIKAYQRAASRSAQKDVVIDLAIMTSDDTHELTEKFLQEHEYFGLSKEQVVLMKQDKVPSLLDNDAHFAPDENDPFVLETKPHGHGDVHALLHRSGLIDKWLEEGKRWVFFFQDTNALAMNALPATLGTSISEDMAVNSISVPRKAGEAAGAIVKLSSPDAAPLTINVEYNQLDALLSDKGGDVPDDSGFSPYPGNINALVFKLEPYARCMRESGGLVPEFVNPKYANEEKTVFKKPTRLECMMQDFPKLLSAEDKVGVTRFGREFCFSAVKNHISQASEKSKQNLPAESASSAEMDFYALMRWRAEEAGMRIEAPEKRDWAGIELEQGACIVMHPSFACTLGQAKDKIKNGRMSKRSVLILEGADIEVEDLELDGALVIRAIEGARVKVKGMRVNNRGWEFQTPGDGASEETGMRGYQIERLETRELVYDTPGDYLVEE